MTANIATSMTNKYVVLTSVVLSFGHANSWNSIRTRPDRGDPAPGTAFASLTYVKIKWVWLTFLIVLEVASVVLLASTIFATNRAKMAILKSSSLATMCMLNEGSRAHIGGATTAGELLQNASTLNVRLERDETGGWRLVT